MRIVEVRLTAELVLAALDKHDGNVGEASNELGLSEDIIAQYIEENPKAFEKYVGDPPGIWWFIADRSIGEFLHKHSFAGYSVTYYGMGQSGQEYYYKFFDRVEFERALHILRGHQLYNVRPMCYARAKKPQ